MDRPCPLALVCGITAATLLMPPGIRIAQAEDVEEVVEEEEMVKEAVRILVSSFDGGTGASVRNLLVKALSKKEGVVLVACADAEETAQKLGIPMDSTSPKNLAKLGEAVGVDTFVFGSIVTEGKLKALELKLIFRVRPDASASMTYTWKTPTPTDAQVQEMAAAIVTATMTAQALAPAGAGGTAGPGPSAWVQPDDGGGGEPAGKKAKKAKQKKVKQKPEAAVETKGPIAKKDRDEVIAFGVGLLLGARKMKIHTDSQGTIEYDGGAFPAIDASIEFFPFRLMTRKLGAGVGLGLHFARSFLLESSVPGGAGNIDTSYTNFDVDVLWRIPLGEWPVELEAKAGWGLLFYSMDTEGILGVPMTSFEYMMVELGVGFTWQALDPWLAVGVGGDVLIPHKWGKAFDAYGMETRGAGGAAHLTLSGEISHGVGWSAGFDYKGLRNAFDDPCVPGVCWIANGRNGTDSYITGWARIGYGW